MGSVPSGRPSNELALWHLGEGPPQAQLLLRLTLGPLVTTLWGPRGLPKGRPPSGEEVWAGYLLTRGKWPKGRSLEKEFTLKIPGDYVSACEKLTGYLSFRLSQLINLGVDGFPRSLPTVEL